MATHERKIRIEWVETDAPPPPVVEVAPAETAVVVVDEEERLRSAARRERIWSICLWVGACGVFAGVQGWILPAFATMFREVGVSLPAVTEAVLGTPSMIYGLGVLSLLHAAVVTRDTTTRAKLRVAAWVAVVLGIVVTIYALFAPLMPGIQKL